MKYKSFVWSGAIILIVGLVAYSNTFKVPFVFDDRQSIMSNEAIRQVSFAPADLIGSTRSVTYFTFSLNYFFGRFNVVGYHLVNLGIHVSSAWAAGWLAYQLSRKTQTARQSRTVGLVVGLLFVSHPVQTQAITYLVQRLASLTTLFYLLALISYVHWRQGKRAIGWAGLSLLITVLAMHSKESAVTLPVAILGMEWMLFSKSWRRLIGRLPSLVPWLATGLIIPLSLLGAHGWLFGAGSFSDFIGGISLQTISQASTMNPIVSRTSYALTQLPVLVTYMRLLLWPVNQQIDYWFPAVDSLFDVRVIAALVIVAGVLFFGWWLARQGRKLAAFGIGFFFLTLLPESSFFPLSDIIFEHRLYLPFLGFALLVGDLTWPQLTTRAGGMKRGGLILMLLVLATLMMATYRRNTVWQSEITLWYDAASKAPQNARAHLNLSSAYMAAGNLTLAQEAVEAAQQANPNFPGIEYKLGVIAQRQGNRVAAAQYFERAMTRGGPFAVEARVQLEQMK
jgi:hypothetical protein